MRSSGLKFRFGPHLITRAIIRGPASAARRRGKTARAPQLFRVGGTRAPRPAATRWKPVGKRSRNRPMDRLELDSARRAFLPPLHRTPEIVFFFFYYPSHRVLRPPTSLYIRLCITYVIYYFVYLPDEMHEKTKNKNRVKRYGPPARLYTIERWLFFVIFRVARSVHTPHVHRRAATIILSAA